MKNNLIYMNNNEGNNHDNTNYKMIKELNKTTPKNKTKIKKEVNSSKKDISMASKTICKSVDL